MPQERDRRLTRRRIFDIIQLGNVSDLPSRAFDYFLVGVILANILALFLETFDSLSRWDGLFSAVEIGSVAIFCVEYALRIWTADYLYPQRSRADAVLHYLISFDGVVSLLSILPFFFLSGAVVFRMLRVVRILHLFRINANYDSFHVFTSVLIARKNQILSSLFIVLVLMLAASLCMYSVEHEAQPDQFQNAFSGMWWSVSALLTVGYGDIYPITTLGRILAVIISFLGVLAVAVPTGIISAGFVEQYPRVQEQLLSGISHLELEPLEPAFTVCQLEDYSQVDWSRPFFFSGATDGEKSLVCPQDQVPENVLSREDGWRAFRIRGTLDFSLIGILAGISRTLAEAHIGIFVISTWNTDYVLTKQENFPDALHALQSAGYRIAR